MERVRERPAQEPAIKLPSETIWPSKKSELKRSDLKKTKRKNLRRPINDRPKWIPDHILDDWDTDVYAYQTEEDLMPAGGPHGEVLGDIWGIIKERLRKRNLILLMDTFMLFRDEDNIKNRNAPDLIVVPYQEGDETPSSYDLETDPTPLCAFEVVSPSSKKKDEDSPRFYIEQLGIPSCVIIEHVDRNGKLLKEAKLSVWRQDLDTGYAVAVAPNSEGRCWVPEMKMWIGVQGQSTYFVDGETGKLLFDAETERLAREAAEKRIQIAEKQVQKARTDAVTSQERIQAAEERAKAAQERIEAERLEREAAQERVETERLEREAAEERAKAAQVRIEAERLEREEAEKRALTAEAEIARLRALLQGKE